MKNWINKYDTYLVMAWGLFLFMPFLGSVHLFDWDEVNFAESAREMLVSGNYQKVQINFLPFMEKPPLFFWLQALSMKFFGINEFAARFPNAIIGIITLILVFKIGKSRVNRTFGFLWVLFISGSLTPHLYFKTGIIDPLYNLFIFLAVYQLFLYTENRLSKHAWLLGVFIGLAIITKGPVAVVVVVLCFLCYWIMQRFKQFFQWIHILQTFTAALLVSSLWFGIETMQNGPEFLVEFLKYQADLFLNPVAGHGQPIWYHPLILLIGCFPASAMAIPVLFDRNKNREKSALLKIMQLFFWVVLILFSLVETKIVHYSSLCYLPLTFMAAYFVDSWMQAKVKITLLQRVLFLITGLLLSMVFLFIPFVDHLKAYFIPLVQDEFAKACLQVTGNWTVYDIIPGILFFSVVLYTFYYFSKKHVFIGIQRFLLLSSVLIPLLLVFLARGVEKYSQGPAIEFFESLQGKDVYVETLGYKSYAQYFYARVLMHENVNSKNTHWLLTGDLDKDAYFAVHVNSVGDHVNPTMKEIGRNGGFVFFKREVGAKFSEDIIKP